MTSKMIALSGAALALLMVSSFPIPADARQGGGGHGFSGGHIGGAHMGRVHVGGVHMGARGFVASPRFAHHPNFDHRRIHRRVFVTAPFFYGGYSYDNGCYWLRRNAVYSGSSYWWNRYYACIYGYGY